jgi:hypothetical protein
MAAVDMSLVARSEYAVHQLIKRNKNWAQREPGVIVVFVIVFLVAILVIAMFINKRVCFQSTLHCAHVLTRILRGKQPGPASLPHKIPPQVEWK